MNEDSNWLRPSNLFNINSKHIIKSCAGLIMTLSVIFFIPVTVIFITQINSKLKMTGVKSKKIDVDKKTMQKEKLEKLL